MWGTMIGNIAELYFQETEIERQRERERERDRYRRGRRGKG